MAFLCFTASYIDSWRAVVISTSAHLFFVALIVATNIPESPRYLLKNKDKEAKQVCDAVLRSRLGVVGVLFSNTRGLLGNTYLEVLLTNTPQVLKIMASWNKVKLPDEFEIRQPDENTCQHVR